MRKFGVNLYGDPLYRIVLASSVMHLVGGQWPDGTRAYRWVPRYRNPRSQWILEAWAPARISQREWDSYADPITGWPLLGPYPSRGEYECAWEFDKGVDADNLETIIGAIEKGRNRSFQDVRDFAAKEYAQEQSAMRSARDAEIRDSFTAFGVLPKAFSSMSGVSRGTKTLPELRSANELGLPIPGARPKTSNRIGHRRQFDVRDAEVTSSFLSR
jgi:hypothetical protein